MRNKVGEYGFRVPGGAQIKAASSAGRNGHKAEWGHDLNHMMEIHMLTSMVHFCRNLGRSSYRLPRNPLWVVYGYP